MSELSDAELEKVAGGVTPAIVSITVIVSVAGSAISAVATHHEEGW